MDEIRKEAMSNIAGKGKRNLYLQLTRKKDYQLADERIEELRQKVSELTQDLSNMRRERDINSEQVKILKKRHKEQAEEIKTLKRKVKKYETNNI